LTEMDHTQDLLTPRALPELLRALLISGIPPEPVDVGV
jgi:hypothetical protein